MKSLTTKEEEILHYFWSKGPLFVKQLIEEMDEPKPHYNTISTFVRGLEEKGYLGYHAFGNTYQYYPLISEEEYKRKTLKKVISTYFDNSYTRVVSTLIEDDKISIEELQQLIQQIKNSQK